MQTLPAVAERHHRCPPWVRAGSVMKPSAGKAAGVTPRQLAVAGTVGTDWLAVA
jgi:hypothetical protein